MKINNGFFFQIINKKLVQINFVIYYFINQMSVI